MFDIKAFLKLSLFLILGLSLSQCKEDDQPIVEEGPNLIFQFKFDDEQQRLNNFGNPAEIPAGNAAQTPRFNSMSAHYIELAPSHLTLLGNGQIVYKGEETDAGGAMGVDFSKASVVAEGDDFVSIPLKDVAAGTYEWVRVSLTYQNYDIDFSAQGFNLSGTIASFVGYNTYIDQFTIDEEELVVNDDKLQGFWAFETHDGALPIDLEVISGESAQTTVPNPLFNTSPIPAGSCVVTGSFEDAFEITGNETEDVIITLSVTTNNSFEWQDLNSNGIYEPLDNEMVVDMGLRGLVPMVK